jgi:hypothetical protein
VVTVTGPIILKVQFIKPLMNMRSMEAVDIVLMVTALKLR